MDLNPAKACFPPQKNNSELNLPIWTIAIHRSPEVHSQGIHKSGQDTCACYFLRTFPRKLSKPTKLCISQNPQTNILIEAKYWETCCRTYVRLTTYLCIHSRVFSSLDLAGAGAGAVVLSPPLKSFHLLNPTNLLCSNAAHLHFFLELHHIKASPLGVQISSLFGRDIDLHGDLSSFSITETPTLPSLASRPDSRKTNGRLIATS